MDSNIQKIVEYVANLEQELYDWDGDGPQWQQELTTLHPMIETLMKLTFEETDSTKRSLLAAIEYKARRCRDCILTRTGIIN